MRTEARQRVRAIFAAVRVRAPAGMGREGPSVGAPTMSLSAMPKR